MRILRILGDVFDVVEAGIALTVGTALAVGLLVVAPAVLAWTLFQQGRFVLTGFIVTLFGLTLVTTIRDVRARRVSWVSAGLAALWTLCTAYAGLRLLIT